MAPFELTPVSPKYRSFVGKLLIKLLKDYRTSKH